MTTNSVPPSQLPFQLPSQFPAESLAPEIISQTSQWLVVSKPSGWLTIPGRDSQKMGIAPAPVLSEWAKQNFPSIFVVHRLDRETSGIVLFALTPEDHKQANLWFQNRKIKKIYHCLAQGRPSAPILKINFPIAGAPSMTQVEVKERYEEGFLAQVVPRTGRRHQIRIHLSNHGAELNQAAKSNQVAESNPEAEPTQEAQSIQKAENGFPIWGDTLYGGPRKIVLGNRTLIVPRVALHASSLELPTGEVFKAEFAPDFADWLAQLRKEGHRV